MQRSYHLRRCMRNCCLAKFNLWVISAGDDWVEFISGITCWGNYWLCESRQSSWLTNASYQINVVFSRTIWLVILATDISFFDTCQAFPANFYELVFFREPIFPKLDFYIPLPKFLYFCLLFSFTAANFWESFLISHTSAISSISLILLS